MGTTTPTRKRIAARVMSPAALRDDEQLPLVVFARQIAPHPEPGAGLVVPNAHEPGTGTRAAPRTPDAAPRIARFGGG
jgi:hypothetical protein